MRIYRGWPRRANPRRVIGLLLGLAALLALDARAADYGVFIDVENEEQLLDLLTAREIDETTFDILLELLHDGVDLNNADREGLYTLPNLNYADADAIIEYRGMVGTIDHPGDLAAAEVISKRKLLAIAPFIVLSDRKIDWTDTHGRFRYMTTYVGGDEDVPSMWLGARVSTLKHLELGLVGVLTRTRVSDVVYDPGRDALSARTPELKPHLPKFFVQWEDDLLHIAAGTYRIGFGQRLTFDNTGRVTPNGIILDDAIYITQDLSRICRESKGELDESPCGGARQYEYRSPDYRWSDRLRGAAVGLKSLDTGAGWIQAYGFASYQTHGIYQYELYDRGRCDDPTDDEDENCKAPDVFRRQDNNLRPTSEISYSTLPEMFNELTAGGNFSYFIDRRTHVGVTGYGADVTWLVEDIDLDFQEWSRRPYGGRYGAVGLDGSWGYDLVDLFAEVTRSIDSQPAGGGWAALLRGTVTWQDHEIEAAARYYHQDFANPFARPISAADEYDGLRARDEVGGRLRYAGEIGDLGLRAGLDLWSSLVKQLRPSDPTTRERPAKLRLTLRGDYDVVRWFKPGVWFEYSDKNLADTGRGNCYETSSEEIADEPVPCAGEKLQAGVQLRFEPMRDLAITAKYQHRWLDDEKWDDRFRQDLSAWLLVSYAPIEDLRLRARARYLDEATTRSSYLERSVWFFVEAAYWYERLFRIKLRYELYKLLDERDSTAERRPEPAHWVRAELEFRF